VASFAIVPDDTAVNNAPFCTAVKVPEAVKVILTVLVLVFAECVSVVATALVRPLVVISDASVVSPAAGATVSEETPMYWSTVVTAGVI
jgi:hypothetical protein